MTKHDKVINYNMEVLISQ